MSEVKGVSEGTPKRILLSYLYIGNCPDCNSKVETLEQDIKVDTRNHHFVVAYCMNCKKQVKVRETPKLEDEEVV